MPSANPAPLVAGVELGGTKCLCMLASGPDDICAEVRVATRGPAETLTAVGAVLARWHTQHAFRALGVASFGPLDLELGSPDYGLILGTPKPGWGGVAPLTHWRALGVPVAIDTDVNAAALAEGLWGAARGLGSWVYVTVGTGIGVGTMIGGRALRGLGHSEAGHQRVPRLAGASWPGSCPFHGDCVEGLASGTAIQARTGFAAEALATDHPVWAEVVHALTGLFHNLVVTVVPERIVVGGGVALGHSELLPRIRRALDVSLEGYAHAGRIARRAEEFLVPPGLGERAGALGAIALAGRALHEGPRG